MAFIQEHNIEKMIRILENWTILETYILEIKICEDLEVEFVLNNILASFSVLYKTTN